MSTHAEKVACDTCRLELTRHNLKRHKKNMHGISVTKHTKDDGYSDEEEVYTPKNTCSDCKQTFTTEGFRTHKSSKSACRKRIILDSRPTCCCDVTLMLNEIENDICHGCEERSKINAKIEADPIQIHNGFSKIFAYCPEEKYKHAPMLHMEDIKNQIFKSAFLSPGETPMHLRLHEPVIIPDDNECLRESASELVTYQEAVKTFCVHSKFWKALLLHAKKCKFIKSIKSIEKLRVDLQKLFGLQDDGNLDAHILYWLVFSPHAFVFHDFGSQNCFLVHPIVSLSGHIRVWSTNCCAYPQDISPFYHYLKRMRFLTTEGCPCSCEYDEEF